MAVRIAQSGAAAFPGVAHIGPQPTGNSQEKFPRTISRGEPEVPLCVGRRRPTHKGTSGRPRQIVR